MRSPFNRGLRYATRIGFLATDDIHIPGNFGIKDQMQALRWVSTEIHAFSGDPNAVTIFGHDAGAISVSILMLATDARGKRSICLSDTSCLSCPPLVTSMTSSGLMY